MREIPNLHKNLVSELTVAKTNELIKKVVPRPKSNPVITSLTHIESCKSLTSVLFDADTGNAPVQKDADDGFRVIENEAKGDNKKIVIWPKSKFEYCPILKSTLEIHLQTLNEKDKAFEDVGNSNARNDGYVVTDATKVGEDIDNNVEDVFDVTAQFMTSLSKWAGGSDGANETSFSGDEDYDMYDGYEDCAYDLTEEHKSFYQAWDINFRCKFKC
nr:hypothetical protein [Tanacetum cinerariifolium]